MSRVHLFVTSPTSQLIVQPFRCFTYVTAHSPTLPLLHLRHSSFSNPSFASPTSQAFHLIHLASRPCPNNFQTSYPMYIVPYQNSPTPQITFPNFEKCAREKLLKYIFPHLINMGKFSNSHYDPDICLRSLKFSI